MSILASRCRKNHKNVLIAQPYWRLFNIVNYLPPDFIRIGEIQMANEFGGPQLCVGGASSASSFSTAGHSYTSDYAVDDDWGQYNPGFSVNAWASNTRNNNPGEWWQYQFTSSVLIIELRLFSQDYSQDGSLIYQNGPQSFDLQNSPDGITWTTIQSFSGLGVYSPETPKICNVIDGTSVDGDVPAVDPTFNKQWRVNISLNNGNFYTNIADLSWRSVPGGTNLVPIQTDGSGTYSESSEANADNAGWKAYDGDNTTKWSPAGNTGWLSWQFAPGNETGHIQQILEVGIMGRAIGQDGTYAPNDFTIESSYNGSTWTVIKTITGQTGWSEGELRLFSTT